MNKSLVLFMLAAMSYAFNSHAAVISVDFNMSQRNEQLISFSETHYETTDLGSVAVSGQRSNTYIVDFEEARNSGKEVKLYDESDFASYNTLLLLQGENNKGPFFEEMMSLVDMSAYSTFYSNFYLSLNSFFLKDPSDPFGSEGLQFGYSFAGYKTTISGGIEVREAFTYFSTFYVGVTQIDKFEDFKLTSLDNIYQALEDNQSNSFSYSESLVFSTEHTDVATKEWNRIDHEIDNRGVATYTITGKVSEPTGLALFLFGACGLALVRRKHK